MTIRPSPLSAAIQLALALGLSPSVQAQPFSAEIELSELDGTNGFVVDGSQYTSFPISVSGAGDINGDGFDDVIIGDSNGYPTADRFEAGTSWLVFGSNSGFQSPLLLSSFDGTNGIAIDGEISEDRSGLSVSGAGDFNNDGIDDLIIGAPLADPNGDISGRSYVVFGSASGLAPLDLSDLNGSNGFAINGEQEIDQSGISVSDAGDINGDGIADIIIGASTSDNNKFNAGSSYVLFGSNTLQTEPFELSNVNGLNGFAMLGEMSSELSGRSVSAAGDVNGDGIDDVIIGAPGAGPNGSGSGRSYVVFGSSGPLPNPLLLSNLDGTNGFALNGADISDASGYSVSGAGDVNGDSIDDLIISARSADSNNDNAGRSYVVFGSITSFGSELELSSINGINGFVINGEEEDDFSGDSVSGAGDVNGDGIDDLIIGAFRSEQNGFNSGRAYVVFGSRNTLPSPFQLTSLNGTNGFAINSEQAGFRTGRSVSGAGDVNGDGIDDIALSANRADTKYGEGTGRSYIVFGRPSIDLAISKTNGQGFVDPEGSVTYVIDISNPGPVDVTGAILSDILPPSLDLASATWSCDVAVGTVCLTANGTGNLNETVDLPEGSSLSYSITANVVADEGELIINTATINLPDELVDANPSNNSATDTDPTAMFADSFEVEI